MTLLEQADRVLVLYVNQFAGRSIVLDKTIYDMADTSLLKGGIFLAVYWWMWFETDKDGTHSQRRTLVVSLLAASIVAVVSRALQVSLPFHLRPLHTPDFGLQVPFGVNPLTLNHFSSFPSDHAMLFFALCVPLWMRARWLGIVAGLWTLVVVCGPRIYLGYHWPSDVVAGAILGVGLMLLLCRLIGRTGFADWVLRFSKNHPPAFYALAWLFAFELALLFGDLRAYLLDAYYLARMLV